MNAAASSCRTWTNDTRSATPCSTAACRESATSLGSTESLVEHRASVEDKKHGYLEKWDRMAPNDKAELILHAEDGQPAQ